MAETFHKGTRGLSRGETLGLYGLVLVPIFAAILSAEVGVIAAGRWILGWPVGTWNIPGAIGPWVNLPNVMVANLATLAILRWLGVSRHGKSAEEYARVGEPEEAGFREVVEIRPPRWPAYLSLSMGVAMGLMAWVLTTKERAEPWVVPMGFAVAGFFLLSGLHQSNKLWRGNPVARVDDAGISAIVSGWTDRSRFVAWSDVARCEVETLRNIHGEPYLLKPTLKGWDGRVLLKPTLAFTNFRRQEELVKAIRARLPKSVDDFLD